MTDLIKREDAINVIERCRHRLEGNGNTYQIMLDMTKSIPPAENKGEWITDIYKLGKERHRCSECGTGSVEDSNFCPNCGADCRGGKANE